MMTTAFDNEKYLLTQSEHIRNRIAQFGGKLYLEFGGKLYDDYHASRVLPGVQPDSKLRMLLQMKEQVEIIVAINADDIEKNKIRKGCWYIATVDRRSSIVPVHRHIHPGVKRIMRSRQRN